ncbi:MAG: MbcA/ParS/Xre antitoxin family protein [Raoultibacter sp.]
MDELPSSTTLRPTELLCGDSTHLSVSIIHSLIEKGFELKNVEAMVSSSELFSKKQILKQILGESELTAHQQRVRSGDFRINAQQSATAFRFAETLEYAIRIFGEQKLAEEWLARSCRHMNGAVPVDMIDDPVGFRTVKQYLRRIEYGIYQ